MVYINVAVLLLFLSFQSTVTVVGKKIKRNHIKKNKKMARMYNILCLAIIAIIARVNAATDYCSLKSCTDRGYVQTMCKYPVSSTNVESMQLTTNFIIYMINRIRIRLFHLNYIKEQQSVNHF